MHARDIKLNTTGALIEVEIHKKCSFKECYLFVPFPFPTIVSFALMGSTTMDSMDSMVLVHHNSSAIFLVDDY